MSLLSPLVLYSLSSSSIPFASDAGHITSHHHHMPFRSALNGHPCCPRRTIVDSLQYACCSPCPSRCHAPSSWWQSVHPLTHLAGPLPVMFHCSCCRGSGTSDRTVQFALLLLTTIIHRCQAWKRFYRSLYLLKNFTVASNAPSLPALILGLLCMFAVSIRSKHHWDRDPNTYQITTHSEAVGAAIPVCTLVSRGKLATTEDLVCDLLGFLRELRVGLTAVDQQRRLRLVAVFLVELRSESGSVHAHRRAHGCS